MDLFDLVAKITLDSSEYEEGLNRSEKSASSFGKRLKGALKTGGAAIGAITVATGAMTTALVNATGNVAEYGDNIDKMSQKLGISSDAYQEWDAVLQHSGSSIDAMSRGMVTLQKNAVDNAEAFEALGISQEQLATMSTEELFSATITGLQEMGEGAERTALASKLLGGSAKELGPLLNTSAEDTAAMKNRVHELGGVMSKEAVKAAAKYQDSLQDLKTAFSGLSRGLLTDFMPSITTVMDGLTEIFSGNTEGGLAIISEGIDNFAETLTEKLPEFGSVALGIIEAIGTALIENIPTLASAAISLVVDLVGFLIDNLPMLVDVALQIILTLADALTQNLPTLIPAVVEVILTIVDKLTEPDMLGQLVDAAIQLIIALAEGLIAALPKLIEKAPEIVINLVTAIIQNAPKLLEAAGELIATLILGIGNVLGDVVEKGKEIIDSVKEGISKKIEEAKQWGKDLIDNFIQGIKDKASDLWKEVENIANGVKNFLGFSEPKKGPLSNFHTYAPDMMELFAKGIRDNENVVTDQIAKSFDFGNDLYSNDFTGGSRKSFGAMNNSFGAVSISIYPQEGQSAEDIAEQVMYRIQEETERKAAVFA